MVGKGGGERLQSEVFQQNRYCYIEFGYRNAYYETKSAEIAIFGGIPQFWREFPCNDIMISPILIILPKKSPKTRCARDFI